LKQLLTALIFLTFTTPLFAEYSFTPAKDGKNTRSLSGTPHLSLKTECEKRKNKKAEPKCTKTLVNQNGDEFFKYRTSTHSVSLDLLTRYKENAFALINISETRENGTNTSFIVDDKNKRYTYLGAASDAHKKIISANGEIISIAEQGIYQHSQKSLDAPENLVEADLTHNIEGEISSIAIGQSGKIYTSDTKRWMDTGVILSERGDRLGVIASFPDPENDNIYGAVYKYTNLYNKGLILFRSNFETMASHYGWLFNSDKKNIGFSPKIYSNENNVIVSARNSTESENIHFSV